MPKNLPDSLVSLFKPYDEFGLSYWYPHVAIWNYERELGKRDPAKYLPEEIEEFINAPSFPEMVQEYCDIWFVLFGIVSKLPYFPPYSMEDVEDIFKNVNVLTAVLSHKAFLWGVRENQLSGIMVNCFGFVVRANNSKPKIVKDGKVIKGENYVSPLQDIIEFCAAYKKKD